MDVKEKIKEAMKDYRGVYDLDSFELPALEPPKDPECECGARKTSNTPDYCPGHSTWCPVAEDEETKEI